MGPPIKAALTIVVGCSSLVLILVVYCAWLRDAHARSPGSVEYLEKLVQGLPPSETSEARLAQIIRDKGYSVYSCGVGDSATCVSIPDCGPCRLDSPGFTVIIKRSNSRFESTVETHFFYP